MHHLENCIFTLWDKGQLRQMFTPKPSPVSWIKGEPVGKHCIKKERNVCDLWKEKLQLGLVGRASSMNSPFMLSLTPLPVPRYCSILLKEASRDTFPSFILDAAPWWSEGHQGKAEKFVLHRGTRQKQREEREERRRVRQDWKSKTGVSLFCSNPWEKTHCSTG